MRPKAKTHYIVLLWTLPADVFAWLAVAFVRVLWGTPTHWVGLVLQTEFRADSWPMNPRSFLGGWYRNWGGTNFGHGAIYRPGRTGGPGLDTSTEVHEHHHAEQVEVAMLVSFVLGIVVYFAGVELATALAVWGFGAVLYYLAAVVVALVRGEAGYRGNVLEEGAYGVDDKVPAGTVMKVRAPERLEVGDPVVVIGGEAFKVRKAKGVPRVAEVYSMVGVNHVEVMIK